MKLNALLCWSLLLSGGALAVSQPSLAPTIQDYARLAPFTAVRWEGDTPQVRHEGTFYELLELETHSAADLVAFAKKTYRSRWSKRIAEDIVQVLTELGTPPGNTVRMRLRDLESGAEQTLDATMTADKRLAAWEFNQTDREPVVVKRVTRKHAARMPAEWKASMAPEWLEGAVSGRGAALLPAEVVQQDLDQLEWLLEDQYSYLHMTGVDYRGALDALRLAGSNGLPRAAFALQLSKFLALFGDGHTRIDESLGRMLPPGRAPYLLFDTADGVACVQGDRSGPMDADAPYLEAIDGIGIERWIEAGQALSSAGSQAWVRGRAIENLRYIGWVAMELGHELGDELELTLTGDGRAKTVAVPVSRRRALYGGWPRTESQVLEDDFGYLRIPSMESEPAFLEHLERWMEHFAEADGLILDVRGNGGGSRDALRLIYPMLMEPGEAPVVVNVAKYKLRERDPRTAESGYLSNRTLYPAGWSGWGDAERDAIGAFDARFEPAWTPDEEQFSEWHYMLMSPGQPSVRYSGQVVLLIDGGCFSATDIFASAFAARDDVTVIGTPTGGGSGRSQGGQLAGSGLRLRMSSMASFQASGQPYDGVGVHPDVMVDQPAEYYWGGRDAALEAALKHLRSGR